MNKLLGRGMMSGMVISDDLVSAHQDMINDLELMEVVEHCITKHKVPSGSIIDPTILGLGKELPKMENPFTKYDLIPPAHGMVKTKTRDDYRMYYITGYVPKSTKDKLVERLGRELFYQTTQADKADLLIVGNQPSKSLLASHKGYTVSVLSLAGCTHYIEFSKRIGKLRARKV